MRHGARAPDAQVFVVFFFSSRRRHTRWTGDWSSDVCSSDLGRRRGRSVASKVMAVLGAFTPARPVLSLNEVAKLTDFPLSRSEERRVGKECRSRWSADH